MPRILDTYRDETGLPVTPTFAAYMIEGGFSRYLDAQTAGGFNEWLRARWREFGGGLTLAAMPPSPERAQAFRTWLNDRAVDQLAQRKVEAAA